MTIQCCKCLRVREDKAWRPSPGLLLTSVNHTYCPSCFEAFAREIREYQTLKRLEELTPRLASPALALNP
jgi:hypothetical protein